MELTDITEPYHFGPAVDSHPGMEGRGQQDDEQQGEQEGSAADKLKCVETK